MKSIFLTLLITGASSLALACPNLSGNYSCVSSHSLGYFDKILIQTPDYFQFRGAAVMSFKKPLIVREDGMTFIFTQSCRNNQIISSMALDNEEISRTIYTQTEYGYETYQNTYFPDTGVVQEYTEVCRRK